MRAMCENIGNKRNDRKINVQTRHATASKTCSTTRGFQTKLDADNASGDITHIPIFLNSSATHNSNV